MVCPVTTKGAQTRTIYLPEGNWFDYWTGKKYAGRQYINVVTPLDIIPVFVKSGAIIPLQPAMEFAGEKPIDLVTLDIFPGSGGSFNLYEDNGGSLAYQQNEFSTSFIATSMSQGNLDLTINKPEGRFRPAKHRYLLDLHLDSKPLKVFENKSVLAEVNNLNDLSESRGWYFDQKARLLYIKPSADNTEDISIRCQW